jgi:hypothetical protein
MCWILVTGIIAIILKNNEDCQYNYHNSGHFSSACLLFQTQPYRFVCTSQTQYDKQLLEDRCATFWKVVNTKYTSDNGPSPK